MKDFSPIFHGVTALALLCSSCGGEGDDSGDDAKQELQDDADSTSDTPTGPTSTVSASEVGMPSHPPGEQHGVGDPEELCLPRPEGGRVPIEPDPDCENSACGDVCDPCLGLSPCAANDAYDFMCNQDARCVAVERATEN